MAKVKKAYFCKICGFESPKWKGQCQSCQQWNTFTEEIIHKPTAQEVKSSAWQPKTNQKNKPKLIKEVVTGLTARYTTTDEELNRVLRGGLVNGFLLLVGGQPGIGKST